MFHSNRLQHPLMNLSQKRQTLGVWFHIIWLKLWQLMSIWPSGLVVFPIASNWVVNVFIIRLPGVWYKLHTVKDQKDQGNCHCRTSGTVYSNSLYHWKAMHNTYPFVTHSYFVNTLYCKLCSTPSWQYMRGRRKWLSANGYVLAWPVIEKSMVRTSFVTVFAPPTCSDLLQPVLLIDSTKALPCVIMSVW